MLILLADYSLFDTKPIEFKRIPKNHDLVNDFKDEKDLNRIIAISQGWYSIAKRDETLYFNDLRFGAYDIDVADPKFVFSYKLEENAGKLEVEEVPRDPENAKKVFSNLATRVFGN